jgi:precorrin-3B synthase
MTARAIFFSQLRGACPGLSLPMQTGDGLLVRLMPIGTIPLETFSALCAAAGRHGNGVIEITGRGSIQVRGLTAASAPRFADAVAALDIAATEGIPVLSDALAGLDPEEILDAATLAADLRRALARTSLAARLAPKLSVAVDGGGALNLDNLSADVRICAQTADNGVVLRIGAGGNDATAVHIGTIAPADGVEAAVRLLEVIAQRGRRTRARDVLAGTGAAPFRSVLSDLIIADAAPPRRCKSHDPIGSHRLRDGSVAVGAGLAFGHADSTTLERLADAANAAGATGIRTGPSRALTIIGLARQAAPTLASAAESLGLIVDPADPRRRIVACAGAPICASAHIAARALAPLVATIAAPHLDSSRHIHISGCAKGCAHAGSAALTIVGAETGCALIANGSTRDVPFDVIATNGLAAAIERYVREPAREDGDA